MNSEKITDIFIKTYHKDFVWLFYCIKSIHKFAKNFRKVIIVSDNDGNDIPKIITDIMPLEIFYTNVPDTVPANLKNSIGYIWQQIVKISWMDYTDADAVLILDSDWMLSKDFSVKDLVDNEGKFYWFYRDWNLAEEAICWKIPTTIFLQREPRYESMCIPGYILERNTTIRFIDYVMKIHNKTTFWDIFTVPDIYAFSEFNAYGNFVDSVDEDNNVYHKKVNVTDYTPFYNNIIIISWSWGGLKEDDKKKREEILELNDVEINQVNIYFEGLIELETTDKKYKLPYENDTNLRMTTSNRKSIMKMDLRNN